MCSSDLQIKNLEEEKSRLQEENSKLQQQVQAAQVCKYSIFFLDLTHMIGVVKSYLPQFNLAPIAKGIAPNYSDEKFREYCKESEVIAEEILKNIAE